MKKLRVKNKALTGPFASPPSIASSAISPYVLLSSGSHWGSLKCIEEVFLERFPRSLKEANVGFMVRMMRRGHEGDARHGRKSQSEKELVETVKLKLSNPKKTFEEMIRFFFCFHDPTVKLPGYNDEFTSAIFVTDNEQTNIALRVKDELQTMIDSGRVDWFAGKRILTEVGPAHNFGKDVRTQEEYLLKYEDRYRHQFLRMDRWPMLKKKCARKKTRLHYLSLNKFVGGSVKKMIRGRKKKKGIDGDKLNIIKTTDSSDSNSIENADITTKLIAREKVHKQMIEPISQSELSENIQRKHASKLIDKYTVPNYGNNAYEAAGEACKSAIESETMPTSSGRQYSNDATVNEHEKIKPDLDKDGQILKKLLGNEEINVQKKASVIQGQLVKMENEANTMNKNNILTSSNSPSNTINSGRIENKSVIGKWDKKQNVEVIPLLDDSGEVELVKINRPHVSKNVVGENKDFKGVTANLDEEMHKLYVDFSNKSIGSNSISDEETDGSIDIRTLGLTETNNQSSCCGSSLSPSDNSFSDESTYDSCDNSCSDSSGTFSSKDTDEESSGTNSRYSEDLGSQGQSFSSSSSESSKFKPMFFTSTRRPVDKKSRPVNKKKIY